MEDAADPHKPAVRDRTTIATAVQSFRDDEKSHHLSKHSLKKSEFFFEKQLKGWAKDQGSDVSGSANRSRTHRVSRAMGKRIWYYAAQTRETDCIFLVLCADGLAGQEPRGVTEASEG